MKMRFRCHRRIPTLGRTLGSVDSRAFVVPLCSFLVLLGFFSFVSPTHAQIDPTALNRILGTYRTDSGDLNYGGAKEKEGGRLRVLVDSFARIDLDRWAALDEETRKAFWLNAHDALLLRQIFEAYPLGSAGDREPRIRFFPKDSVQQIEGFWEKEIPALNGRESLKSIERKLLEEFHDVRAVLALFGGGRGGVPLGKEAWSGRGLSYEIDRRLKEYFASGSGAVLDSPGRVLRLSALVLRFWREQILTQARADIWASAKMPKNLRSEGSSPAVAAWPGYAEEDALLLSFIAPYLPARIQSRVKSVHHQLKEIAFDWTLNDATPPPEPKEGIPLDPEEPFKNLDADDVEEGELDIIVNPEHLPKKAEKRLKPGELRPLLGE